MDKNLTIKTDEVRKESSQKVLKPCPQCGKLLVIVSGSNDMIGMAVIQSL